jgi:putative DNA primase/helicase
MNNTDKFICLPQQMRDANRWLLWKSLLNSDPNKKPRKVPFYANGRPRNGELDGPEDMRMFATFGDALFALQSGDYAGLGFALGADWTGNHWQGIDLDYLAQHPELAKISAELPGYTELSPSGTGRHAIGWGRPFKSLGSNGSGIEAYSGGRFFTVTAEGAGVPSLVDLSDFVEQRLLPLHRSKSSSTTPPNDPDLPCEFVSPQTIADLRSALQFMRADDRDLWQRMGHALKTLGDVGRGLFMDWSATSDKFDPLADAKTWESFRPNRTGYKAIFTEAQRRGWVNPVQRQSQNDAKQAKQSDKESVIGEQLAATYADTLCFDEVAGEWYWQKNGLWQQISKKKVQGIVNRDLYKFMPGGFAIAKLNAIETFLTIHLLLDKWQQDGNLLPLKNGVLDVSNRLLMPYAPHHRFNWQLPYEYNPEAEFKVIKNWLYEATSGDENAINIIRAFFKMALVGGDIQKFLELIGPGGTGKSTLTRLLVAFIGELNTVTTDLKNLESNRFETAALYGKKLALITDENKYGGDVSQLKRITGGDPLRFEHKNKQQKGTGFVYKGMVVVTSNEAIQTSDYTSGLIRRRMPVNFNRKISDADKARWSLFGGIENVMITELPGLLNWALAMSDDEVTAAIGGINGEMSQIQREHLVDTNKIAKWLDDNIIIDETANTFIGKSTDGDSYVFNRGNLINTKLYSNYEGWCKGENCHPVALNRFSAILLDLCEHLKINVSKHRVADGNYINGLRIRQMHDIQPTPVTRQFVGGAVSIDKNAESMLYQPPVNAGRAGNAV